jgi:hypothetical protein
MRNPSKSLVSRRILEVVAMMMIGDGMIGLIAPRRHVLLWDGGPRIWRRVTESCVRHTSMTRTIGLVSLVGGLLLASRQLSRGLPGRIRRKENYVRTLRRVADAVTS